MYILANTLMGQPVMSLQTGQAVATLGEPLVNPANFEILALRCQSETLPDYRGVILMRDIRQFASDCVIIDSLDEIEDVAEIVRLRPVAERNFNVLNKLVVNESQHRLGKVEDFTINLKTFMLQKLYVHQSLVRSIMFNSLVVDRTQVIDVSNDRIMVRDAAVKAPLLQPKTLPQSD